MWKLVVIRNYKTASGYNMEEKIPFECASLEEAAEIILTFEEHGTDAYTYCAIPIKEGGENNE